MQEYEALTQSMEDLRQCVEDFHELDVGMAEVDSAYQYAQKAYHHIVNYGVTKDMLKCFNADGYLDRVAGDVILEVEYYETYAKSTIRAARARYTAALEEAQRTIWQRIWDFIKKLFEAIKNFFRAITGFMSSREYEIRRYNHAVRSLPYKEGWEEYQVPNGSHIMDVSAAMKVADCFSKSITTLFKQSVDLNKWFADSLKQLEKAAENPTQENLATSIYAKFEPIAKNIISANSILSACGIEIDMDKDTGVFSSRVETTKTVVIPATVKVGTKMKDTGWDRDKVRAILAKWAEGWKPVNTYSKGSTIWGNPDYLKKIDKLLTSIDKKQQDNPGLINPYTDIRVQLRKLSKIVASLDRTTMQVFVSMERVIHAVMKDVANGLWGERRLSFIPAT